MSDSILGAALNALEAREPPLAVPLSTVPAINPKHLWPGVIPFRSPVMWAGPGKTGKGLAIAAVGGVLTTGRPFPGEPYGTVHEPGGMIIVAPEDDANEDLVFRFRAAGADLDLVQVMTFLPDGSRFVWPGNKAQLKRAVTAMQKDVKNVLVAIDPLMPVTRSRLTGNVWAFTDPLTELAQDTGAAVLVSHHTTKDPRNIAGSKSLTDAFRSVWQLQRRDEDDQEDPWRMLECVQANRETGGPFWLQIEGSGTEARAVFMAAEPDATEPGSRASRLRMEPERGATGPIAMYRRRMLVKRLLSTACPENDGPAGRSCTDMTAGEMCRLDVTGTTRVHTSRVEAAVSAGRVSLDKILAQFGDNPPAGIAAMRKGRP